MKGDIPSGLCICDGLISRPGVIPGVTLPGVAPPSITPRSSASAAMSTSSCASSTRASSTKRSNAPVPTGQSAPMRMFSDTPAMASRSAKVAARNRISVVSSNEAWCSGPVSARLMPWRVMAMK